MGKIFNKITERHKKWIGQQKIFFVATAPSGEKGHINVSPKGLDTFRVIDNLTVAYLDLSGSGLETIAHVKQNARITIMLTAFDGPPKTLRLYGSGSVHHHGSPQFEKLSKHFNLHTGSRSIIQIDLTRIQDSCGYSIPLFEYIGDRDVYDKYCEIKGRDAIEKSLTERKVSIDGISIDQSY